MQCLKVCVQLYPDTEMSGNLWLLGAVSGTKGSIACIMLGRRRRKHLFYESHHTQTFSIHSQNQYLPPFAMYSSLFSLCAWKHARKLKADMKMSWPPLLLLLSIFRSVSLSEPTAHHPGQLAGQEGEANRPHHSTVAAGNATTIGICAGSGADSELGSSH